MHGPVLVFCLKCLDQDSMDFPLHGMLVHGLFCRVKNTSALNNLIHYQSLVRSHLILLITGHDAHTTHSL